MLIENNNITECGEIFGTTIDIKMYLGRRIYFSRFYRNSEVDVSIFLEKNVQPSGSNKF